MTFKQQDEEISMNEEFIKNIYKTIVEDGRNMYKELYENTEMTERTVDYWKDALELYRVFNDNQKTVFLNIIQQTMIDTISHVFGVLDGSSTSVGGDFACEVKINGISTEDELQDSFLRIVEENQ